MHFQPGPQPGSIRTSELQPQHTPCDSLPLKFRLFSLYASKLGFVLFCGLRFQFECIKWHVAANSRPDKPTQDHRTHYRASKNGNAFQNWSIEYLNTWFGWTSDFRWVRFDWHGVAWRGVAWRGVAWRGMAWHGVAWARCLRTQEVDFMLVSGRK